MYKQTYLAANGWFMLSASSVSKPSKYTMDHIKIVDRFIKTKRKWLIQVMFSCIPWLLMDLHLEDTKPEITPKRVCDRQISSIF